MALSKNEYKNWKELCEEMGWKTTGGNYLDARKKELNSICAWHKEGQKIIIDKVYKIQKIENQLSSSEIIVNIQLLILDMLVKSKENKCVITMKNMIKLFKMVNNNFLHSISDIAETLDIDEGIAADVLSIINSTSREHIVRALRGLERKGLIIFSEMTFFNKIIYETKTDENGNCIYNDDGNIVKVSTGKIQYNYVPNDEELEQFRKIRRNVMRELRIYDLGKINSNKNPSLTRTFYNTLNVQLRKEMNVDRAYKSYKLVYDYDEIIKELSIRKLKAIQGFVNKTIIDKCRRTISNVKCDTTFLEDTEKFKQMIIDEIGKDLFEALYSDDIKDVQAYVIRDYIEAKGVRNMDSYESDGNRIIDVTMTTSTRTKVKGVEIN
jgi:hypothetical protein